MRSILLAATAVLATSVAASAQIGFEIDLSPPTGANANDPSLGLWWNPDTTPTIPFHSTSNVRFRIHAPEGTWVRPIISFELDTSTAAGQAVQAAHPWLTNQTPATLGSLANTIGGIFQLPNGTPATIDSQNAGEFVLRQDAMLRWISFAATNGQPTTGPTGGRQWFQPILSPSTGVIGSRIWTTDPAGWAHGNGPLNTAIWQGMQGSDASPTDTFDPIACFKWSLSEHSIFVTGSEQAALTLLDSDEWNSILEQNLFKLSIQIVGLRPPVSFGPMPSDASVPDLFSPDAPLTMVSPGFSFAVTRPAPNSSYYFPFAELQNVSAGKAVFFESLTARNPVEVAFPTIDAGGNLVTKIVRAYASPTITQPGRFKVIAPINVVSGTTEIRDLIRTWQPLGQIIVP